MAYVLRGHSNPSILDTYEEERRAHALQLIEFDREIFRLFRKDTFTSEGYFEYVIQVLASSQGRLTTLQAVETAHDVSSVSLHSVTQLANLPRTVGSDTSTSLA